MTGPRGVADRHTAAGEQALAAALADEHAALLRGATARAADVTAVLDAGRWPQAELGTLVTFLRASLLRQVSDEEVRLFPPDPYHGPFGELTAEHARLAAMTADLDRMCADGCMPARLRALIAELLAALERHLVEEQAVLAGQPMSDADVPATARADRPVVIRLDGLPRGEAVQGCIERLLRLRRGQCAEIHASDARRLDEVRRWMAEFDSAGYGVTLMSAQGGRTVLQITRRPSG